MEKPILEDNASLPWLDFPWIDRLRDFLCRTDAKIELTDAWTQQRQGAGDKSLMDHFWADKTLTPQDLKHINYC